MSFKIIKRTTEQTCNGCGKTLRTNRVKIKQIDGDKSRVLCHFCGQLLILADAYALMKLNGELEASGLTPLWHSRSIRLCAVLREDQGLEHLMDKESVKRVKKLNKQFIGQ